MITVTWAADGTVTFDVATAVEVAEVIRALQRDFTPSVKYEDGDVSSAVFSADEIRALEAAEAGYEDAELTEPKPEPKPVKRRRKVRQHGGVRLSAASHETWQYLRANDTPEGVSNGQVAKKFHLNGPAANFRLRKLMELGIAYKVSRGRYRAGELG